MTAQEAARVLGLRGTETRAEIEAIASAQARALDLRIQQASGEEREGLVRSREDVELAGLALLGTRDRTGGTGGSGYTLEDALTIFSVLVLAAVYIGTLIWLARSEPVRGFSPGESMTLTLVGTLCWWIGAAVTTGVFCGIGKLFGRDWSEVGMGVCAVSTIALFLLSRDGNPVRVVAGRHIGASFAAVLVFAGVYGLGRFLGRIPGGGNQQ